MWKIVLNNGMMMTSLSEDIIEAIKEAQAKWPKASITKVYSTGIE